MPSRVFKAPIGYTLQAAGAPLSPNDATTYFIGGSFSSAIGGAGNSRIYFPKAGTIRSIRVFFANPGTLGTNEQSTISIRINDTTDHVISSTVVNNATQTLASNSAMAVKVANTDFFELKWVTPTWGTKPTLVRINATVYVEA
jgi:hypothetical protein